MTGFINRIVPLVQKYAPEYGIAVCSPIIAQAILESGHGTSDKVQLGQNYFGLKWRNNRCVISNDYFEAKSKEQNKDGSYREITTRWCKFRNMEECVIGYFQWTNIPNYKNLKGVTDPEQYLINIKSDGYATSLYYVQNLMDVIERYDLTQYDKKVEVQVMSKKRVCIDAGHYGKYNRCPGNKNYYESLVMWKLHLLQKKYLEQFGVEVVTTRAIQTKDLALQTRGKKATGCDLFISDHTNAVGSGMNENVDYVAVYHLTADTTTLCDDISKEIAEKIAPVIADVMGTEQGYKVVTRKADSDRNKDGMMNDNYYGVLHGARLVNVPGLILEHSFHTNTKAVSWLLNDDNLDKLAKAEAECIVACLNDKVVNTPTTNNKIESEPSGASTEVFKIKVSNVAKGDVLNIRKEATASSAITGKLAYNDPNVYTIVEVKNGWGKLKSGIGWINLKYTKRV